VEEALAAKATAEATWWSTLVAYGGHVTGSAGRALDRAIHQEQHALRRAKREIARLASLPPRTTPRVVRGQCNARTRKGYPCKASPVWDDANDRPRNGRCRLHGGLSTGPKRDRWLQGFFAKLAPRSTRGRFCKADAPDLRTRIPWSDVP